MRTIIAGSRGIEDVEVVRRAIEECPWQITEIVSGAARGVDSIAIKEAIARDIPLKTFPVTTLAWKALGRRAGPIRNGKMAQYADALIAIWDGKSAGTANMIEQAKNRRLQIHIINYPVAE
jgi:hypothetical protein